MIADRHLEYPFHREELVEALGELKQSRLVNGSRRIPRPKRLESEALQFVTYTPELFSVVDQLVRIAALNVTMLLVGKTGTGKTTLAHLIHQLSPRSEEPFQNVACGALPPDLIESELFGHVRGAFTGADRSKIGRFEAAGNGTLLLDEIDVLGPKEQAKLLKVIETGEFEPVGSTETRISNARLIVASNVDLETLTQEQKFRSDLYYRLNVLEFRLPSIKDRPFDIFPLALQFIEECCQQHNISVHRLHRHFIEALKQYPWPGNIRELKNQVQRAVLFCNRDELTVEDLSPAILNMQQEILESAVFQCSGTSLAERVALTERRIVEATLKAHGYKRTATAEALGISRVGLYKKMRKHGMLNGNGNKGG
jgi:DNA-binding NtrC family response regulator